VSHLWHNPHATTAFSLDPSGKGQQRMTDETHLAFIRKLPSLVSGGQGCEACHVRYGDPRHKKAKTAKGRKPDDAWTVPMLPEEHRLQHSGNEKAFWDHIGIDPLEVARQLYAVSGDVKAGRKIIMNARRATK
jgi:hypothetical protein